MPAFNSEWKFLAKFVSDKASQAYETSKEDAKMFFVKVIASDGYFVNVTYDTAEGITTPISGIPIIQSPYNTSPVMPGDTGVLLNCGQDLSSMLEGKSLTTIFKTSYYVFLPLMKKAKFKGNPQSQIITSPTGQTTLTINDQGVVIKVSQNTEINSEGSLKLNSADISITSDNPMQIGELATILNDLCSALSGFMTTPTAPGAPAAADPGFVSQIAQIQSAIGQAFK